MKTNFENLKDNVVKKLNNITEDIINAKTYNEAYDLWEKFSSQIFPDLTGELICNYCSKEDMDCCDCNCHENCKEWLESEVV